jgi:putative copper resistance protein D
VSFLGHPVLGWVAFAVTQYATHFTPFYDATLENDLIHEFEHLLYLGTGIMFWWPLIGLDPLRRKLSFPLRLVYLVAAMPVQPLVGVVIFFAGRPLYQHYASLPPPWGPSALADQEAAGALMWVSGELVMTVAGVLLGAAWFRQERRRQRRIEQRLDNAQVESAGGTIRQAGPSPGRRND